MIIEEIERMIEGCERMGGGLEGKEQREWIKMIKEGMIKEKDNWRRRKND